MTENTDKEFNRRVNKRRCECGNWSRLGNQCEECFRRDNPHYVPPECVSCGDDEGSLVRVRGMCPRCYALWRREHGSSCLSPGCARERFKSGRCVTHYHEYLENEARRQRGYRTSNLTKRAEDFIMEYLDEQKTVTFNELLDIFPKMPTWDVRAAVQILVDRILVVVIPAGEDDDNDTYTLRS